MKKLVLVVLLAVLLLVSSCSPTPETFSGKVIAVKVQGLGGLERSVIYFEDRSTLRIRGSIALELGETYTITATSRRFGAYYRVDTVTKEE